MFRGNGEAYGERCAVTSHAAICGNVLSGLNLAHPTWIGRSEWFRQNPYRCGFRLTEDRELLMRTRNNSNFAALLEPLLGYREDSGACERPFQHAFICVAPTWKMLFCAVICSMAWEALSFRPLSPCWT